MKVEPKHVWLARQIGASPVALARYTDDLEQRILFGNSAIAAPKGILYARDTTTPDKGPGGST